MPNPSLHPDWFLIVWTEITTWHLIFCKSDSHLEVSWNAVPNRFEQMCIRQCSSCQSKSDFWHIQFVSRLILIVWTETATWKKYFANRICIQSDFNRCVLGYVTTASQNQIYAISSLYLMVDWFLSGQPNGT